MSAGTGLRRRRRGYARNRPENGRWRSYSRSYPRRRTSNRRGARRPAAAGAINAFARLGFVVRGIAYIVIGVIAIMVALGFAKHSPDRTGAIEAIATKPFGYLLLWILVIGFLGMAVWRFVQAAVMRLNLTEGHRVRAFIYGVGYAILFVSTLMYVVYGRTPTGSDAAARDYTAQVLSLDGGQVIVAVAGIVLAVLGIILAIRGLGAEFTRHLRMGWMNSSTREAVIRLGQVGYVARGVVLVGIGIAALDAALTYDAARAEGVDGALRSFAQTAFGPWLLILVALGLIAFGILSFFEAKWRRTLGGVPV
jgi:Domain of Unknown Function (DUF1206)